MNDDHITVCIIQHTCRVGVPSPSDFTRVAAVIDHNGSLCVAPVAIIAREYAIPPLERFWRRMVGIGKQVCSVAECKVLPSGIDGLAVICGWLLLLRRAHRTWLLVCWFVCLFLLLVVVMSRVTEIAPLFASCCQEFSLSFFCRDAIYLSIWTSKRMPTSPF